MKAKSRTGLLAGVEKPVLRYKPLAVDLSAMASPAPLAIRPFYGLYNPFPYGCSILCNHPADTEAKIVLKKAKYIWAGRSMAPFEQITALREHLQLQNLVNMQDHEDAVPEELFRRYTDTDSRPLTPAPTIASTRTKGSGATRRCVTPDLSAQQRPKLVLDLRRSHSQETLCWNTVMNLSEPDLQMDLHTIYSVPKWSPRCDNELQKLNVNMNEENSVFEKVITSHQEDARPIDAAVMEADATEVNRRRGKKKKPRATTTVFPGIQDPETQVSTLGPDSHNPSARGSLVPEGTETDSQTNKKDGFQDGKTDHDTINRRSGLNVADENFKHSVLEPELLKQLGRQLNREAIETEFNNHRRMALEETLRVMHAIRKFKKGMPDSIAKVKQELNIPPSKAEKWLPLPRSFSRSSARFEIPVDIRKLKNLTPIQYLSQYVIVSCGRLQLFNRVFVLFQNKQVEIDEDQTPEKNGCEQNRNENKPRWMSGECLPEAVKTMMGGSFSPDRYNLVGDLVEWKNDVKISFRTWAGICALCERLIGSLQTQEKDPCHEVEEADFRTFTKIITVDPSFMPADSKLLKLLSLIRDA